MKSKKEQIKELEKSIEILQEQISKKWKNMPPTQNFKSFDEWEDYLQPESTLISQLEMDRNLIRDFELSEPPSYGDKMPINEFVQYCKDGWFIDYDGSGNYATKDKMSNISISPSTVMSNKVRTDFDYVIWFNR